MSLFGAMFSGVSGLFAQSQSMGMISDNISNVNTIGFKRTFAKFATLSTESATPTLYSPGGVQSLPFAQVDKQGLLQASGSSTDIAINGAGFLPVTNSAIGGVAGSDRLFTRAGSFAVDANGFLVNTAGMFLLGQPIAPGATQAQIDAMVASEVEALQLVEVENLAGLAGPSTTADLNANLSATATTGNTFQTVLQLFDQNGIANNVTATFTKTAVLGQWTVAFSNPVFSSSGAANGTLTAAGSTTMTFNAGVPNANLAVTLTVDWANSATNSAVAIDLGTANQADGMTNFGEQSFVSSYEQNGFAPGDFTGITFDRRGVVFANFDNGQNLAIFKVPVVTFQNPNGLLGESGNVFRETTASGESLEAFPGNGRSGSIAPSSLESSTVDLAEEFSNMIITQRAYSASGKIITTADEMLDELIRLKR